MTGRALAPPRESSPAAPRPRRTIALGAAGYAAFAALQAADGFLRRSSVSTEAKGRPATADYGEDGTYYAGLVHERSAVFGRHSDTRYGTSSVSNSGSPGSGPSSRPCTGMARASG